MNSKSEFRRIYGQARLHLREVGYKGDNGKSLVEAEPANRKPYFIQTLKEHFEVLTGRDYTSTIEDVVWGRVKPDAVCGVLQVIAMRRTERFYPWPKRNIVLPQPKLP